VQRALTLVVENGLSAGVSLQLAADSVNLIGRATDAALLLHADELSVSRRHCVIEVANGIATVKNLVDADRTLVNGANVSGSAVLKPGDRIAIGSVTLRLFAPTQLPASDTSDALDLSFTDVEEIAEAPAHAEDRLSMERVVATVSVEGADAVRVARALPCDACGAVDGAQLDPDHAASPWLCPSCAARRRAEQTLRARQIGPYEIFRKLGEGGMGVVYEGIDTRSSVRVALKVLRPDGKPSEKEIQRFVREQGIALTLRHPNIVRTFQVGAQEKLFFIASEFVAGGDATSLVGSESVREILRVGADLFRALAYAHEQGVVHRDVKPANLLVTNPDATGLRRGRLMDFGLAKNVKELNQRMLTAQGEAGGTLTMISPEQLVNFAGATSSVDVYSGAATLYRLLSGRDALVLPPSAREPSFAMIAGAVMSNERRPLATARAGLPAELCVLLDGLLARDATVRMRTPAADVADTLERMG
jgi:hypothetical protein